MFLSPAFATDQHSTDKYLLHPWSSLNSCTCPGRVSLMLLLGCWDQDHALLLRSVPVLWWEFPEKTDKYSSFQSPLSNLTQADRLIR